MKEFTKILTKEQENQLNPEQKTKYRLWKKTQNINRDKDINLDTLVSLAQKIRSQRYAYYKINPNGTLGKENQEIQWRYIVNSGTPEKIIKALKTLDYLEYRDILNDILVEGLKFPVFNVRKESNIFYDKLLSNGLVDLSLWRKILEKNYLSKRTWRKLTQYYPISKEIGTSKQIFECISDFAQRAKDSGEEIHIQQWAEIKNNPIEIYFN